MKSTILQNHGALDYLLLEVHGSNSPAYVVLVYLTLNKLYATRNIYETLLNLFHNHHCGYLVCMNLPIPWTFNAKSSCSLLHPHSSYLCPAFCYPYK